MPSLAIRAAQMAAAGASSPSKRDATPACGAGRWLQGGDSRPGASRRRARPRLLAAQNHDVLPEGESSRKPLYSIAAPTLVIHGTADPMFPIGHGEALAEEIPRQVLLRLEGAGPGVDRADWERIIPAILAHTASSQGAGETFSANGQTLIPVAALGNNDSPLPPRWHAADPRALQVQLKRRQLQSRPFRKGRHTCVQQLKIVTRRDRLTPECALGEGHKECRFRVSPEAGAADRGAPFLHVCAAARRASWGLTPLVPSL